MAMALAPPGPPADAEFHCREEVAVVDDVEETER